MSQVWIKLETSEEGAQELEDMMRASNLSSRKELLNSALMLFKKVQKGIMDGKIVALVDESNQSYTEIDMPAFDDIKRNH